jgi:hypothetical protein
MTDQLGDLAPITEVLGPGGVHASYSDHQIWSSSRGAYGPGWKIEVDAVYKGARIQFSESHLELAEAAALAFAHLKRALALK